MVKLLSILLFGLACESAGVILLKKGMTHIGEINGYDFFKAFTLSSIGVDFHVTQVVDGTQGIHSMIPKAIFADKKFEYWTSAP